MIPPAPNSARRGVSEPPNDSAGKIRPPGGSRPFPDGSAHGPMTLRRWTVSQIGAREGYAAGRAFAEVGRLRGLYTEAWCRYGAGLLRRGPAACRVFAGRFHADL